MNVETPTALRSSISSSKGWTQGFAVLGLCGLLGCGSGAGDPSSVGQGAARRPSVILIVIDTLRADHLGSYGYARETSFHMDSLAGDSVRYARALSQAPWTTPSIGSLMTSLYPTTLGIQDRRSILSTERYLLAEALQASGWATGAVVSHSFCSTRWNFDQGFEEFDESNIRGHEAVTSAGVSDRANEFVDRHRDEAFFLWAHYFDPHFAYVEHADFRFSSGSSYTGPIRSGMKFRKLRRMETQLQPADVEELQRLYDSEIAYTDRQVGRLLTHLKELGIYDGAIVILTADHGEEFLDHGQLGHAKTLYQELLHVPLLIKLPGVMPQVVEGTVGLVDVMPTVLDFLDLEIPAGLEGRSILPRRLGPNSARPVFSESSRGGGLRSVAWGEDKLIQRRDTGTTELFRLGDDPQERSEGAGQDSREVRERLQTLLDAWSKRLAKDAEPGDRLRLSDEEVQHLESLGYLE